MKDVIVTRLNDLVFQVIGMRRVLRFFRSSIIRLWRKLDSAKAWPDVDFFIDNAPKKIWGGVGGESYTGWIYAQGFFAALIKSHAPSSPLRIFDFGCGYGKLAPLSEFFCHPSGEYIGVDIRQDCIDFCKRQYAHLPKARFALSKDFNDTYSEQHPAFPNFHTYPPQSTYGTDWPVDDESVDVIVAISVFTHLQEAEAHEYIRKIHRTLKPGGLAILTFHIVQDPQLGPRFTSTTKPAITKLFDFHKALPPSCNWFTSVPERPEDAIALNMKGFENLVRGNFSVESIIRGSTTGGDDPFFQDIAILRK